MISGRVVEIGDIEQFFADPQRPRSKAFLRGDLVYRRSVGQHPGNASAAKDTQPPTNHEDPGMNPDLLTSLSRSIDPRYPSNRLALAGSAVAALLTAVAGLVSVDLGFGPLGAAIAVFLAWAIARELDPDHPASAAIAMPAAFVLLLAVGQASLLLGTAVLLASRITAGTVGTDLRMLDGIALIGLCGLLGTQSVGVVGLALLVAGVFISGRSTGGSAIASVVSVGAFAATWTWAGTELAWETPAAAGWATLAVTLIATALIVPASPLKSQTDRKTGTVGRTRVTVARLLVGAAVAAAFLVAGGIGIQAIAPTATAALIGTAVAPSRSRTMNGVRLQ